MSSDPYKGVVADLIDPYLTGESKSANGGFRCEGGQYAIWWLKRHPGRWALVGEGSTGLSSVLLERAGLVGAKRTSKIDGKVRYYGQLPHPEAETLTEALHRRPMEGIYIPELTRSEFNWTPDELAEACDVARANLFPTGA